MLKGWNDKTDNDPIKNGIKNKVKKRLSRYLDIIKSINQGTKEIFFQFFSFH